MAEHAAIEAYIRRGMAGVDGWFTRLDATLLATVAAAQARDGIAGSVGEIGVHHGRMFIILALALRPGERAFAVDIFGEQHLNQDRSGRGDEAVFRRNLARFGIAAERVAVLRTSSLDIGWAEIAAQVEAPARLFSVDGGHTAGITRNDLAIAEDGLAPGGVVVLDDCFSPAFPGVSEGAARFMLERPGRLVPFAIGDGRTFFSRPDHAPRYARALRDGPAGAYLLKETQFWGSEVAVFRTPTRLLHHLQRSRIARRLRDHPVGIALQPVVRRFLSG
jgi:predicted O-methyltransferase YrrM